VTVVPAVKISKKLNNRNPEQSVSLVLLRPGWYQGVITMSEVLRDVKPTMTLISYLSENTVGCD